MENFFQLKALCPNPLIHSFASKIRLFIILISVLIFQIIADGFFKRNNTEHYNQKQYGQALSGYSTCFFLPWIWQQDQQDEQPLQGYYLYIDTEVNKTFIYILLYFFELGLLFYASRHKPVTYHDLVIALLKVLLVYLLIKRLWEHE